MRAIVFNRPSRTRVYAWDCIHVAPNPPRAGQVTRLTFPMVNPGPKPVVVERLDVWIPPFGIGVRGEQLPPLGPVTLAADPDHIEELATEWVPTEAGHRCVRATIHVQNSAPIHVGRNLDVIEATADEREWRVPFRLGNPEPVAAPIVLRTRGNDPNGDLLEAVVHAGARELPLGRPVWLEPEEELAAELVLRASHAEALDHWRALEGYLHGRLLDGIQVTVRRPALATPPATDDGSDYVAVREHVEELVAVG
jgi:hypothetical protein